MGAKGFTPQPTRRDTFARYDRLFVSNPETKLKLHQNWSNQ